MSEPLVGVTQHLDLREKEEANYDSLFMIPYLRYVNKCGEARF